MALFRYNLRRHILNSSTVSKGFLVIAPALLAQAKVNKFNMSIGSDKNIFWFQVSEDNADFVQVPQRERDLAKIKFYF